MSHGNARLTFHGRCLLVYRVRTEGQLVSHVAKAMGVSRQCGSRWLDRFDEEGEDGLYDRSSRPHSSPTKTSDEVEQQILDARVEHRRGQDWLGAELDVAPPTVSRILRRHDMPRLCELDPLTGDVFEVVTRPKKKYFVFMCIFLSALYTNYGCGPCLTHFGTEGHST